MSIRLHRLPAGVAACFLLLLATALVPPPLPALAAPPDFALLRSLREAGRQEAALAEVRRALRAGPGDPDLLLFEGQLLTDLGRYRRAEAVLARAIGIAPDYPDLRLALARTLFFAGHHERALEALAPLLRGEGRDPRPWLLAARIRFAADDLPGAAAAIARLRRLAPDDAEGLLTAADIARRRGHLRLAAARYEKLLEAPGYEELVRRRLAGLEAERRRFRLTVAGRLGRYDDGDRDPWRSGSLELAWRHDEETWLRGRLDLRDRFGETDLGVLVTLERRLREVTTLEVGLGGAPAADFSPRFEAVLGLAHRLRRGGLGDTVGSTRFRLRRYPDGRVSGLELGLTQYLLDGRLWLTGTLVHTRDEDGGRDFGFAARVDGLPRAGWRLFAGTTLERDELERGTTLARTVFAGVAVDLDERLRLFLDFGVTDRDDGGLRREVGVGVTVAF